jgi:hypothetical protein
VVPMLLLRRLVLQSFTATRVYPATVTHALLHGFE